MRTNVDIDEDLMNAAMAASGQSTKKATIEEGLKAIIRLHGQRDALDKLWGIGWEGDLDQMREDWSDDKS